MLIYVSIVDKYYHPHFSSRDLWYTNLKLRSYRIEAQGVLILSCVQTWTQSRPPTCLYSDRDSPRKDTGLFALPDFSHKSFTRRADTVFGRGEEKVTRSQEQSTFQVSVPMGILSS